MKGPIRGIGGLACAGVVAFVASCAEPADRREPAAGPGPARLVRVWSVDPLPGEAMLMAVSADGTRVATAGRDDRIVVYDSADLRVIRVFRAAGTTRMKAVALSPDGRFVAGLCHCGPQDVRAWDVETGAALETESSGAFSGRSYRRFRGEVTVYHPPDEVSLVPESDPAWLIVASTAPPGRAPIPAFGGESWSRDGLRIWVADANPFESAHDRPRIFRAYDAVTAKSLGALCPRMAWNGKSGPWTVDPTGERLALVRDGAVFESPLSGEQDAREFGREVKFVVPIEGGWVTSTPGGELTWWKDGAVVRTLAEDAWRVIRMEATPLFLVIHAEASDDPRRQDTILRSPLTGELIAHIENGGVASYRGDGGALVVRVDGGIWRIFRDGVEADAVPVGIRREPPNPEPHPWPTATGVVFLNGGRLAGRDDRTGEELVAEDIHRGKIGDAAWTRDGLVILHVDHFIFLDPEDGRTLKVESFKKFRLAGNLVLDRQKFRIGDSTWPLVSGDGEVVACLVEGVLTLRRAADASEIWRSGATERVSSWNEYLALEGSRVAALVFEDSVAKLRVWDFRENRTVWSVPLDGDSMFGGLLLAPDGKLAVQTLRGTEESGPVTVYDPDGRVLGRIPNAADGSGYSCVFSSDSRWLAACEAGSGVVVMDLAGGGGITRYPLRNPELGVPTDLRRALAGRGFILGGISSYRSCLGFFDSGFLPDSEMWHGEGDGPRFQELPGGGLLSLGNTGLVFRDTRSGGVVGSYPEILGLRLAVSPDGKRFAVVGESSVDLYEVP